MERKPFASSVKVNIGKLIEFSSGEKNSGKAKGDKKRGAGG